MTESAHLHVEATGQRIVEWLQNQPDGVSTVHVLVSELGLSEGELRAALAKLERLGAVDRAHTSDGHEEIILNPASLRNESV
jgi:hypothetical protein